MKNTKIHIARCGAILAAWFVLTAAVIPLIMPSSQASAAQITSRKVELGSSELGGVSTDANGTAVPAGQGGNGAATYHKFTFTPTTATIGGVLFQYCDSPFVGTTCTAPTGLTAASVNAITGSSGYAGTWALDTTTNAVTTGWFATSNNACASATGRTNCILLANSTPTAQAAGAHITTFGAGANWITNPTVVGPNGGTYYVRIVTFSSNTFATAVDNGTVAFDVANDIDITAKVQEQLKFSLSSTANAATASCIALPGGTSLTLGNVGVLDAVTAYDNHSYFRVSANSANGTVIQYTGDTLRTAGNVYSITAPVGMATTAASSTVGSEQFGLGFDSVDTQGGNVPVFTNLTRTALYSTANGTITNGGTATFGFDTTSVTSPKTLASSTGIVGCDTGSIRYIANIAPTTEPGIYKTNIGYIATPMY
jgi:hypothetical protein